MNIAVIDKGEKTQYSALLKTHQKTLIRLNSAAVARFLQGTEKRKGFFHAGFDQRNAKFWHLTYLKKYTA